MIERLVRQTYNNCHYIEIRDQIGVFRKIYCDSIIPNKKYLDVMYLSQCQSKGNTKKLIVVGGNPSLCEKLRIDKTNQTIIGILKKYNYHYDIYYLINLYSDISGSYSILQASQSLESLIVQALNGMTNVDLLMMWGPGLPKKLKPSNGGLLYNWVINNNAKAFVSINSNGFCHGSRANSICMYSNLNQQQQTAIWK